MSLHLRCQRCPNNQNPWYSQNRCCWGLLDSSLRPKMTPHPRHSDPWMAACWAHLTGFLQRIHHPQRKIENHVSIMAKMSSKRRPSSSVLRPPCRTPITLKLDGGGGRPSSPQSGYSPNQGANFVLRGKVRRGTTQNEGRPPSAQRARIFSEYLALSLRNAGV